MASVSGINASTLDVTSIVSQLMAVERQPIDKLNKKTASYETQLSVFGSVRSSVANFQAAIQKLKGSGGFQAFKTSIGDSAVFNASTGTNAVPGNYSIEVSSLAQSQQLVAAGQASATAAIGTGATTTISFDFGTISGGTFNPGSGTYAGASFASNGSGVKTVTIDGTNNTLEGIRDEINKANIGVNATIINDGSGTPYRLALSSASSGVSNSMSISVSGEAAIGSLLNHDPVGTQNLSQTVEAQNANLKVNGVAITKTSNTVGDAIQGVTLNLSKVTTSATSLIVSKDTSAISSAANSFVSAYNDLMNSLKSMSAYKTSTSSAGSLAGDPAVRQMIDELRGIMSGTVAGGTYTMLSDVGFNTKPGTGLVLDTAKFDAAVSSNLTDLSNLFISDNGFATKLDGWAKSTLNVTITSRTANINTAISNISKEVDRLEVRMDSIKKRYTAQFTNLNVILARMSSEQSYVSKIATQQQ